MNRSEVSSKWNKCRIYVGDPLDRWNELKEVLRVQTRPEVAKNLLDSIEGHINRFEFLSSRTIILITIALGLFCQKIVSFVNNTWCLGKRESVNAWKKAHFDGFREKDE
jgi:hypothetical protein